MNKIKAFLISGKVFSNSKESFELFSKNRFGEKMSNKILYSFSETLYLTEKGKMEVFDSRNKELSEKDIFKRFEKYDKDFKNKYLVFRDLRDKGYILKPALKFGADFRVYDKSSSFIEDHSKWICFAVSENKKFSWQDFSAKNRIAHSTKKNLLIAVVDEEGDVTYFEIKWVKA